MSDAPASIANLRGAVDLSALVNRTERAKNDQAGPSAGGLVREATDQNFTEVLELSKTVPVIVDLWATWCQPCKQLSPVLEKVVRDHAGRLVLVTVDVDQNPQLAQAFQAQSIPTVAAVIGGRPVGLFTGAIPEEQVRQVLEQVLQLAAQNGVTGSVGPEGRETSPSEVEVEVAVAPPLAPHAQEAYDAIERGALDAAASAYSTAIAQDPHDDLAVAGLAQVRLLQRTRAIPDESAARAEAAADTADISAHLQVADLDISSGRPEEALRRLLDAFPAASGEEKNVVRERLLDYFHIIGVDDARVIKARARLAMLLY
jgi:putative thioredoxin